MSTTAVVIVVVVCVYLSVGLWVERIWTELDRPHWSVRVALVLTWGLIAMAVALVVALAEYAMRGVDDEFQS